MIKSTATFKLFGGFCAFVVMVGALAIFGCNRAQSRGSYAAANRADCLPKLTLIDQNDRPVSLASLKGKPVLIDFIYSSCSGTCPMMTEKFATVAKLLGASLGNDVRMVSITLDPEHDTPSELRKYAEAHGIDARGWWFLTGKREQIAGELALFKVRAERDADGSIAHPTVGFLLGSDGRQVRQYDGLEVDPKTIVADIEGVLRGG